MWTSGISGFEYAQFLIKLYHAVADGDGWRPEHECTYNPAFGEDGESGSSQMHDDSATAEGSTYRAAVVTAIKSSQEARSSATMIQVG